MSSIPEQGASQNDYQKRFLRLRRNLLLSFSMGVIFVIISVIFLSVRLTELIDKREDISYIINISGRQRMLSQNITKNSLLLLEDSSITSRREQLMTLRALFKSSHEELITNNSSINSKKVDSLFTLLKPSFEGLYATSGLILRDKYGADTKGNLLKYEAVFLPQMDAIVKAYELIGKEGYNVTNRNVKTSNYFIALIVLIASSLVYILTIRIVRSYSNELSSKSSELELAKLEIEKAKLKEQFAYVASHDLQEPVRTILSLTEIISKSHHEQLDSEGKQIVNYIQQSGERMTQQIQGLLKYSRVGKGQSLSKVDLNVVLEEVIQDLSKQIDESAAVITNDLLPVLKGYPIELRSLFQNLISNAIKFRKKTETPAIHISSQQYAAYWEFSVKDNGIGIDKMHSDKVFQIFQRLNKRDDYKGMGIGLALCQHIVQIHKGDIWVESEIGNGTTFKFTLNKKIL